MPDLPYILAGIVYQSDGVTPASGVTVDLIYESTGDILEQTTNANGEVIFDLANLEHGYSTDNYLKIVAIGNTITNQNLKVKFVSNNVCQISNLKVSYETE